MWPKVALTEKNALIHSQWCWWAGGRRLQKKGQQLSRFSYRFDFDFHFKRSTFCPQRDVENFKRHHLLCAARCCSYCCCCWSVCCCCCCIYAQIYVIFMRRHNYKSRSRLESPEYPLSRTRRPSWSRRRNRSRSRSRGQSWSSSDWICGPVSCCPIDIICRPFCGTRAPALQLHLALS